MKNKAKEKQVEIPQLTTDDPDPMHVQNIIFIDEDRYNGAYSGHEYTAWVGGIPDDASGGDSTCYEFWDTNKVIFGGGNTPDEAVADLFKKLWVPGGPYENYCPTLILYTGIYDAFDPTTRAIVLCNRNRDSYDHRIPLVYPEASKLFHHVWG
jgi:hypothetical protein